MLEEQLKAFEKFKKLKVGALFMQMGTGKTKVAIDLVDYNKCDLLVYISPFSTLKNIENELIKWNIKTKYILIGYETISSSKNKYIELLEKMKNKKCFIIADESIFIKNEKTKRYQRLLDIREKCEYALILNGTPLTKNEWDLYNQMNFLSPLIFKMSREEFLNIFFKKITFKRKNEKEHLFYKFSEVNTKYLYDKIEPYIFKCDLKFNKEENEKYNYIEYKSNDYYEKKEKKLLEYMNNYNSEAIINMLNELNVISSTYEDKNKEVAKYIEGKQIICFCNYLEEVRQISNGIDCYIITGDTKNRNEIIERFEKNKKPLIMTMGTGAYSLNLQFCNEIVYSSLTFDFAKVEQSKYRIKRIGQEKDIIYTYFLTDLGINKLILNNLEKKESLENLIKEKIMEGDIEKWVKSI